MFVTEDERPDTDDEESAADFSLDNLELTPLGINLAKRFDQMVGYLTTVKNIASKDRSSSIVQLAEFGKHAGLCELSKKGAADRELLRDIFFARVQLKGESHRIRRQSLLLTMELCSQFGKKELILNEKHFAGAVYFGELANVEARLNISVPPALADIALRWRMFYFHHYMSVALEGLFSWLVSQLTNAGLVGATLESLVAQFAEPTVVKDLSEILKVDLKDSFGKLTPSQLFAKVGLTSGKLDESVSKSIDRKIISQHPFAEDSLEYLLREATHLYSSTGLALPIILLTVTLGRYSQWGTSNYGNWLAGTASDPYLDLVPPVITTGLTRRFGDWWDTPFQEITSFVLARYVVQQHQSMSFEKTSAGDRCLLSVDGSKVISTGTYEKIGMGNPRLRSSIQILSDLGLIEEGEDQVSRLTSEGAAFLKREMAKEAANEVS